METQKINSSKSIKYLKPLAFAVICALGLNVAPASAQVRGDMGVNGNPNQVFTGRTVVTQDEGEAQFSISGDHRRAGDDRLNTLQARAAYGITNSLQAQVSVPLDIYDQSSNFSAQTGVSRLEGGLTYQVTGKSAPLSLAAGMNVEVPLEGRQNDVIGEQPSAGPTFKPNLQVGTGMGFTTMYADVEAELGQDARGLNYSVGAQTPIGVFRPALELNARTMENSGPEYYATPGVFYSISSGTELGVGASIGLNDRSDDSRFSAQLNMTLGR
jgi:hypothetical protein